MKNKNQSGFSLIELMIVVAIIGILASIAIPNYQKFVRKSRQSEAKSTLEAIYTAEKAYQGEFGGFTANLSVVGYAAEGRIHYDCGFSANGRSTAAAGGCNDRVAADRSTVCTGLATNFHTATFGATGVCNNTATGTCADGRTDYGAAVAISTATVPVATPPTFTASCAGAIGNGVAAGDVWDMNQSKNLINRTDGT